MLLFKLQIDCEFGDFCYDSAAISFTFWLQNIYSLSVTLNILKLKLGRFAMMQVTRKVFTSTLCHQQPTSRVLLNNHHLNLYLKLSIFA